ncbi:hypothetical protein H4R35_007140 [Dimargaris xerosporica]|nr:hypothetical protein H4R35_007140 [Dimargaris xerosporica]
MHQCPLGTVLRLLVPDPETLENLDRDLGLDWCEPLNRFSTTALYGHLGIPHISLPPSYGSRRIFQSLWSTTNAPSFWSACQAVHFLAWSQQPQWDHEVQHYTLAMQARCQECLPGLMDQVAALTDPVYALVTCEEPEKPVALAPTFWLRDLAQSDPMASCQSLLPGCRATTSPAATPTALQILHASQLPVVNSTEYAQLVASVPLVTYWFYREANAPTASGNRVRITLPIALGRLLSPAFRVMLQPPYVESQTGNVWVFDPDLQHWLVMLDLLYVAIQLRHFGRLSPNQYPWNQGDKEDYTELIQGGYYDSGSHPSPAAGVSSAKASSTTSFVMPTGSTSDSSGPSNRSNTLLSQADSASAFLTWIFPMNVTRGARIRRLLQWSDYWLVDSIKYACITWILEQFTSHAAVQSSSTYSPRQHRHHQSPHTPHFPSSSTLVSPSLTTGVHHTPPAPAALSLISDSSVFSGLGPTSAPPPPALLSSPTAYSRGLAHQFPGSASVAPQSALFPPNTTYIQELLVWFLYFTLSPHTDQSEPLLECLTRLILLSFPRVAPMDGFLQLLWSPSAAADQIWNRIARLLVT